MFRHLLVPVDGTVACIESIGQALELARLIGARVTFLPVQPGHTDARFDEEREWEIQVRADAAARAQGVPCSSVGTSEASSAEAIVSAAREHGCDLICVAWQGRTVDASPSHGQAYRVLDDARVPVLVWTVEQRPVVMRAICILLERHTAIADQLHTWLAIIRAARVCGIAPGRQAMREIVTRLRELRGRAHRRGEQVGLFTRLRRCTSAVDAELDELERQDQRDGQILDELAGLVEDETQPESSCDRLEQAVRAYAQFVWERMGREEGVVLPAARRYLREADWTAIAMGLDDPMTAVPASRT
jgi:nucleotide-binding universal stress UspA family protein/hemerythrin-like domain-containing protein